MGLLDSLGLKVYTVCLDFLELEYFSYNWFVNREDGSWKR